MLSKTLCCFEGMFSFWIKEKIISKPIRGTELLGWYIQKSQALKHNDSK